MSELREALLEACASLKEIAELAAAEDQLKGITASLMSSLDKVVGGLQESQNSENSKSDIKEEIIDPEVAKGAPPQVQALQLQAAPEVQVQAVPALQVAPIPDVATEAATRASALSNLAASRIIHRQISTSTCQRCNLPIID